MIHTQWHIMLYMARQHGSLMVIVTIKHNKNIMFLLAW